MEKKEQYIDEIKAIKQMMEQSSRFLSLSGLSGILIGIYALIGAYIANLAFHSGLEITDLIKKMLGLALIVLLISLATVLILTYRKTVSDGYKVWNKGTRLMILNLAVPLITGGVLTTVFLMKGYYGSIAASLLVFYGLALINAAKYTRQEIYYMGLCQIILGIIAAFIPNQSILLWAFGFGFVHILYGTIMHFRYDNNTKTKKV